MEMSLSGNALKTFGRSVTCLARVGNDLAIQASSSQLAFHSLNSSRTAFQSITFKPGFFDVYTISGNQVECKVLLKAVCSVLRTPVASVDHLSIKLPEPNAPKLQWTLECFNGMRKSYWITCNVEPNIQHMSLDRTRFLSNFVVRPRDLNKLLANNFVASLQEITIIATEPNSLPSDVASDIGGKAVELRSYKDPTKDNDSSLHTQLWIDPMEEFVQYTHTGDPVDVTFGVKELKAFLSFCEGCEVDIQLYFDKAGEPILMAPKFGLDVGFNSNFDASLVLATMLQSQLNEIHPSEAAPAATPMDKNGRGSDTRVNNSRPNVSENPSEHTRIWSDLSASGNKNVNGAEGRQGRNEINVNASQRRVTTRISSMHISINAPEKESEPVIHSTYRTEKDHNEEPQDKSEINGQDPSQHHRSNWVDEDEEEEEEDDDGEDHELYVQSTPLYHEDH